MKKLTFIFVFLLIAACSFGQAKYYTPYDAQAARLNGSASEDFQVKDITISGAFTKAGYDILTDAEKVQALTGSSTVDFAAEDITATTVTLSDKVQAAWADIRGDVYASGTLNITGKSFLADEVLIATSTDAGDYKLQVAGNIYASENANIDGKVIIDKTTDDGNKLQVNGDISLSQQITFSQGTNAEIVNNTADGSDVSQLRLNAGGDTSSARGAGVLFFGNEHATLPGKMYFDAGSVSTGEILFRTGTTLTTRAVIASSGSVLIGGGTDDTVNKLQVAGSMKLTGITAPTAVAGAIYYSSADNHFYGYNGSTWKQLDN